MINQTDLSTIRGGKNKNIKYYALIDTYTRYIMLFITKAEFMKEYKFRKTVDSVLPFNLGNHYRVARVNAPYMRRKI